MIKIGVISEVNTINFTELNRVCLVMDRQTRTDFTPVWNVEVLIKAYPKETDLPLDFYPVFVRTEIRVKGLDGWHGIDGNGKPYGEIVYDENWTYSLHHELLELAHNPFLREFRKSKSILDNEDDNPQYLEEIADATDKQGYTVDGVKLSNFITPNWYDINNNEFYIKYGTRKEPVKYDFLGLLKNPRELYEGGSVAWLTVKNEYFQAQKVKGTLIIKNLTKGTFIENVADNTTLYGVFGTGLMIGLLYLLFKKR